jgi:putative transposase
MSETRKTFEGELYYVTLTVVGWIDVFTRKEYVYELINNLKYCQESKGLEIYAYVIMSNHIHLIARTNDKKLNELLGNFKSFTAKKLIKMIEKNQQESRKEWLLYMFEYYGKGNKQNKKYQFWQNGNHPIELYSLPIIEQKIKYIHNNPVKQGFVAKPEDYLYSSANEFSDIKVLSF